MHPPPPPCNSNTKILEFDGNNTYRCSDKAGLFMKGKIGHGGNYGLLPPFPPNGYGVRWVWGPPPPPPPLFLRGGSKRHVSEGI